MRGLSSGMSTTPHGDSMGLKGQETVHVTIVMDARMEPHLVKHGISHETMDKDIRGITASD